MRGKTQVGNTPDEGGHGTVLIVSMDTPTRERFTVALRSAGYAVVLAPSGLAALDLVEENRPDVIVLDLDLSDGSGVALHEQLARDRRTNHLPVVVVTGTDWRLRVPPHATLMKPVTPESVVGAVTAAVRKQS